MLELSNSADRVVYAHGTLASTNGMIFKWREPQRHYVQYAYTYTIVRTCMYCHVCCTCTCTCTCTYVRTVLVDGAAGRRCAGALRARVKNQASLNLLSFSSLRLCALATVYGCVSRSAMDSSESYTGSTVKSKRQIEKIKAKALKGTSE